MSYITNTKKRNTFSGVLRCFFGWREGFIWLLVLHNTGKFSTVEPIVLTSFDSSPGPSSVLVGKLKKRDFLRFAAGGCHLAATRVIIADQHLTQYLGQTVPTLKLIWKIYSNFGINMGV